LESNLRTHAKALLIYIDYLPYRHSDPLKLFKFFRGQLTYEASAIETSESRKYEI
jgi:hypothetical protein